MAIDNAKIAAVKTAMDNTYEKRVNKKTTISGSYTGDTDSYPTILACINKFGELVTSWNVTPSDAYYPSEKLVKDTLNNYIEKSQTAGLVKNDGTIDTNTYLTQHQDISGKANSADLATVATSGSYTDLTNVPQTFTPASHTHGNLTATGAIGSDSGKMITTTTNGILVASDMNEQLNSIILSLIAEGTPQLLSEWNIEVVDSQGNQVNKSYELKFTGVMSTFEDNSDIFSLNTDSHGKAVAILDLENGIPFNSNHMTWVGVFDNNVAQTLSHVTFVENNVEIRNYPEDTGGYLQEDDTIAEVWVDGTSNSDSTENWFGTSGILMRIYLA